MKLCTNEKLINYLINKNVKITFEKESELGINVTKYFEYLNGYKFTNTESDEILDVIKDEYNSIDLLIEFLKVTQNDTDLKLHIIEYIFDNVLSNNVKATNDFVAIFIDEFNDDELINFVTVKVNENEELDNIDELIIHKGIKMKRISADDARAIIKSKKLDNTLLVINGQVKEDSMIFDHIFDKKSNRVLGVPCKSSRKFGDYEMSENTFYAIIELYTKDSK